MTRQLSCFNSSWCQTTDRLGPLATQVADAVIKAEEDMKGTRMNELGPGVYLNVKGHNLKDNSISSIRLVSPMGR